MIFKVVHQDHLTVTSLCKGFRSERAVAGLWQSGLIKKERGRKLHTNKTTLQTHLVIPDVHVEAICFRRWPFVAGFLGFQELLPFLQVALPWGIVRVGHPGVLDALNDALQLHVTGSPGLQLVADLSLFVLRQRAKGSKECYLLGQNTTRKFSG